MSTPPSSVPSQCGAARRRVDGTGLRSRVVRLEPRSEQRHENEEEEHAKADHGLAVAEDRGTDEAAAAAPRDPLGERVLVADCSGSIRLMTSPAGRT